MNLRKLGGAVVLLSAACSSGAGQGSSDVADTGPAPDAGAASAEASIANDAAPEAASADAAGPTPAPDAGGARDAGDAGGDAGPAAPRCGTNPPHYVDGANPAASDTGPGTQATPWKTLQQAAAALGPGDTVIIMPATYTGAVNAGASGTATAPICYLARPGAVLHGAPFSITGKSHITLDGLRVEDVPGGDAIAVLGPGTDITISNNTVHDANGSCISAWGSPGNTNPADPMVCPAGPFLCLQNVTITSNTLELCNDGGYDENLTVAQGVDHFLVQGNTLQGPTSGMNGGEGIDLKEGVSNGVVAGNTIHPIARDPGIYVDGGGFWSANPTPLTHDILITGNRLIGQGIRLNSEHGGGVQRVTVENNVVTGAPEDGIVVYLYPNSPGLMDAITIVNNTTYGNSASNPWWYGISLAHPNATNLVVRNNVCFGNLGGQLDLGTAPSINDHNLTSDPLFVDAGSGDFHVQMQSAAIGAGSPMGAPTLDFDGVTRSTTAPTIGAYER